MPGRLVVRRIPDFNADTHRAAGQDTLFDVWRFHAFFTTADAAMLDTVTADKTHRGHAIIEQVHADLKNSALAHLPSGVFTANAAWLVLAVIAFNLTRAAGTLAAAGPGQGDHRDRAPQADHRCPAGSRPPPAASPCTYPKPGPGRTPGHDCSTASRTHQPPRQRPDHPADTGTTQEPRGTARQRGRRITAPSATHPGNHAAKHVQLKKRQAPVELKMVGSGSFAHVYSYVDPTTASRSP